MRAGKVTALGGLVLLAAGCAAPGVPGISTAPPSITPVADLSVDPSAESQGFRTVPSGSPAPSASPSGEQAGSQNGGSAAPGATPLPTPGVVGEGPVRVPPPRVSSYTYVFPVKDCKVSYARKLLVLPKTTIWAKRGCRFVAPIDGTVHEVNRTDRWSASTDRGADREGKFVSIIGVDGVRYLGGHLHSVAKGIRPGVKVKAGQVLGRIGNSGDAANTATNLYFAVSWEAPSDYWWVRRGMVKPWKYLDAWYDGNPTYSPRAEMLALRKRVGATPQCSVRCASKVQPPPVQQRTVPTQRPTPKPKRTKKPDDEFVFIEE